MPPESPELPAQSPTCPPTPPHHPTYKVHLSPSKIHSILSSVFPDETLQSIQQLPSGKSFNNRIYFLALKQPCSSSNPIISPSLVLKISGQFFGPSKVENEVSCLLALETFCPEIPVPRALAFSRDGRDIRRILRHSDSDSPISEPVQVTPSAHEPETQHGWIMMTRLPGQILQHDDLDAEVGEKIMKQLASYVVQWRKMVPPSQEIGNLSFLLDKSRSSGSTPHLLKSHVSGLINAGKSPSHPLLTPEEYYAFTLHDQLHILTTEAIFTPNRSTVSPVIQDLVQNVLPQLSLFSTPDPEEAGPVKTPATIFTHFDLSPRNILLFPNFLTKSKSIAAILDFEFAGFFPRETEYTNTSITHAGDWPAPLWSTFTAELQRLAPDVSIDGKEIGYQQACTLVQIIENIAPWYLREGGIRGVELEKKLADAREVILRGVERLRQLIIAL